MTFAIYARVSTKDQSEEEQIPAIKKAFCLSDDVVVYKEEVSAWNIDKAEKRLEFLRLHDDIKAKKFSRLYIWHIDRLYRNRKKMREFFNMCSFYGVDIYSLNQKWLNDFQSLKSQMPENMRFLIDNMYSLLLDVYAQTAEDESRTKSERVRLKIIKGKDGVTRSTSGKKWGRRSLPKRVIDDVMREWALGKSMRVIAENVFYYDKNKNKKSLSVGAVHKIIYENKDVFDTSNALSFKEQ